LLKFRSVEICYIFQNNLKIQIEQEYIFKNEFHNQARVIIYPHFILHIVNNIH